MSDIIERYKWSIVLVLAAISAVCTIALIAGQIDDDPQPLVVQPGSDLPSDIRVYVSGAVLNPGVYPMSPDARWIDALEVAGGPAEDANLEAINLSQRVFDEAQITVPRVNSDAAVSVASAPGGLVNLNTAGLDTLDTLPGVGEVRAERIILSRDTDGPFAQVEDLVLRDLIPDSVFEDILPLVTVH